MVACHEGYEGRSVSASGAGMEIVAGQIRGAAVVYLRSIPGALFVADRGNQCIQMFDQDGNLCMCEQYAVQPAERVVH